MQKSGGSTNNRDMSEGRHTKEKESPKQCIKAKRASSSAHTEKCPQGLAWGCSDSSAQLKRKEKKKL